MAGLWADGFDHYGGDENNMLDGAWAEYSGDAFGSGGNTMELSTARARTGTYSLKYTPDPIGGEFFGSAHWRRVLGEPMVEAGVGFPIYMDELPNFAGRIGIQFCDQTNTRQVGFYILPTGAVQVYRGGVETINGSIGTLIATSDIGLTAKGWNHLEVFCRIGNADGALEVRANGVTVLNVTGLDTQATDLTEVSQIRIGEIGNATTTPKGMQAAFYIDDMVAWDTTGADVNDFVGDKKVYMRLPDGDTLVEDWAVATGSNTWENLAQVPPDDGNYYITTGTPGDESIVTLDDLPAEVTSIAFIQPTPRAVKTDAGNARITMRIYSGSDVAESDQLALSQATRYFSPIFHNDPATGSPFTAAGFNAATLGIYRAV